MLEVDPREECLLRILHDSEDLPFIDESFSCVTAFLCDPFIGLNFLHEAHRVLVSGGKFIATTPSFEWGMTLRNEIKISQQETRFLKKSGERVEVPSILVTRDKLFNMLEYTGFSKEMIKISNHCLNAYAGELSEDIAKPAKKLNMSPYELEILYLIEAIKK